MSGSSDEFAGLMAEYGRIAALPDSRDKLKLLEEFLRNHAHPALCNHPRRNTLQDIKLHIRDLGEKLRRGP